MLTIITTTKNRPFAIGLLEKWLRRQTYKDFEWIISTDGKTDHLPDWAQVIQLGEKGSQEIDGRKTHKGFYRLNGKVVSRKNYKWHSMLNNLRAGLRVAKHDVVICEDDEFYNDNYLETVAEKLAENELIGFAPSHYYHMPTRTYRNLHNVSHCALATTAWRNEFTSKVIDLIDGDVFLDTKIWDTHEGTIYSNDDLVFSFKFGDGIGESHYSPDGTPDGGMVILRKMLPSWAYREYLELIGTIG